MVVLKQMMEGLFFSRRASAMASEIAARSLHCLLESGPALPYHPYARVTVVDVEDLPPI